VTSAPIQRVQEILVEAGLRPMALPVSVDGTPFEFAAVLTAKDTLDLVVLIDTVDEAPEDRARREVIGLARALDLAGSRRPLTIVLVGPRWSEVTERAMSRVGRVLVCEVVLGDKNRETALRQALAVLLPLKLDPVPDEPGDLWTNVLTRLTSTIEEAALEEILAAATRGAADVEVTLLRYLAEPSEEDTDV
jgi:hypothetical protein